MGSRPKRINFEHAYQHVTSRGTDQWNIFLDDIDRRHFLRLLRRVCRCYQIEVVAFCLMGNHFHLVLYIPRANLSAALRDLKSLYATGYNERHNRTGPVFGSRFFSKVITDERQLLDTVRYTHRNPLDLDPSTNLANYRWSSHRMYLGLTPHPEWLKPNIALEMFGLDYQTLVETPRPEDKVQNLRGRIVRAPGAKTIRSAPSLAEISIAVAHAAGTDLSDVRPRAHNGLIGIAILIAADISGFAATEMANPYGFRSSAAVAKQMQRTRARLAADERLASVRDQALGLLNQAAA